LIKTHDLRERGRERELREMREVREILVDSCHDSLGFLVDFLPFFRRAAEKWRKIKEGGLDR